jgi:polyphosphate glucokinase
MKPWSQQTLTLAIDIGGSQIKASVVDMSGRMIAREMRLPTPAVPTPKAVLEAIRVLAGQLPAYDRISAGFPGYVAEGRVHTAPNLGTEAWHDFPLADALAQHLRKPARVLNDADVQGLGVISGHGLEFVLTLGTGVGSALFKEGLLLPHLELGQHPIHKRKTYDQYLGNAALKKKGRVRWNRRLQKAIVIVHTLINYDMLYLGGGNAAAINFKLPQKVRIASNSGGITGGVKLWDRVLDSVFSHRAQQDQSSPGTRNQHGPRDEEPSRLSANIA